MTIDGNKALSKIHTLINSNLLTVDAIKGLECAVDIIKECDLDLCGDNMTVTLADGNELSPHVFEEIETVENAEVHVCRCINCGKEEIWWERK